MSTKTSSSPVTPPASSPVTTEINTALSSSLESTDSLKPMTIKAQSPAVVELADFKVGVDTVIFFGRYDPKSAASAAGAASRKPIQRLLEPAGYTRASR